jgi:hypothetical protein
VQGIWGEGSSGGCMNHPTFMENPHFSLTADKYATRTTTATHVARPLC